MQQQQQQQQWRIQRQHKEEQAEATRGTGGPIKWLPHKFMSSVCQISWSTWSCHWACGKAARATASWKDRRRGRGTEGAGGQSRKGAVLQEQRTSCSIRNERAEEEPGKGAKRVCKSQAKLMSVCVFVCCLLHVASCCCCYCLSLWVCCSLVLAKFSTSCFELELKKGFSPRLSETTKNSSGLCTPVYVVAVPVVADVDVVVVQFALWLRAIFQLQMLLQLIRLWYI